MLVLNTNKWWNSAFIQNNSFMDWYAPDFDNSLVYSVDFNSSVRISNINFYKEETLIAPYCLVWNADWNNFWTRKSITNSSPTSNTFRYGDVNWQKTWRIETTEWHWAEIVHRMISNSIFKWWEVVWKRMIWDFFRSLTECIQNTRCTNWWTWYTSTICSNTKVVQHIQAWFLRNWALIPIIEYSRNRIDYASAYQSSTFFTFSVSTASNYITFDVQWNWAVAENWDRLYISFYTTREFNYSINTTQSVNIEFYWNKPLSQIDFWTRWSVVAQTTTASYNIPVYRWNNTLTNQWASLAVVNGSDRKRYIQISID